MQKVKLPVLGLGLFLALSTSAFAGSVTVNFGNFGAQDGVAALGASASSAQIATYMTDVLQAAGCSGCSVTLPTSAVSVSGASNNGYSQGAVTDTTYNGENHVVGPGSGGQSTTLGDTSNATSNSATPGSSYTDFLSNVNNSSSQVSNQITLQFSGLTNETLTINSFAYEIFPCQSGLGNCTSPPDMTFEAGTNTTGVDSLVTSFGTDGTQTGVTPSTTGSDGSSVHSPNSGSHSDETSSQYIGTWTAGDSIDAGSAGVAELDFIDWPAAIGLDNLSVTVTTDASPVPEPAGIALFGTLVVLLTGKLRKTS